MPSNPRRERSRGFAPTLAAALLGAALAAGTPASADVGTAIGGMAAFTSDGKSAFAGIGTLGLGSFPVIPIRPQVTGTYLFGSTAGRFALTGEAQFGGQRFFAGAGAGVGSFRSSGAHTGPMFDAFAGMRVAPFTSIQLRLYGSTSQASGGATMLGVTFGF